MGSERQLRDAVHAALQYLEGLEAGAPGEDDARLQTLAQLRSALAPPPAPEPACAAKPAPHADEDARNAAVRDALGPDLLRLAERANLDETFIAGRLLGARAPFTATEVALECFGMPNKHERERMQQVIEALERAGLLVRLDPAGIRWSPPGA
ncbi:hypothetical protein EPN44_09770 [bacterium]|nr:MAG: hypothetical protein EPN44_09770 [bacterium]